MFIAPAMDTVSTNGTGENMNENIMQHNQQDTIQKMEGIEKDHSDDEAQALFFFCLFSALITASYYLAIQHHLLIGLLAWNIALFSLGFYSAQYYSLWEVLGGSAYMMITSTPCILLGMASDRISSSRFVRLFCQTLFAFFVILLSYGVTRRLSSSDKQERNKPRAKSLSDSFNRVLLVPFWAASTVFVWWTIQSIQAVDSSFGRSVLYAFMICSGMLIFSAFVARSTCGPALASYIVSISAVSILLGIAVEPISSNRWERCLYHMVFAQIILLPPEICQLYWSYRKKPTDAVVHNVDLELGQSARSEEQPQNNQILPTESVDPANLIAEPPPAYTKVV